MSEANRKLQNLIRCAQAGDKDALGNLLDGQKTWLIILASMGMKPELRAQVGKSDLVQQTILSAVKAFPQFKGESSREFHVWLKRILDRNLIDTARHHGAEKRNAGVAVRLGKSPEHGNVDVPDVIPSPSDFAIFNERSVEVAEALAVLPQDQQEAIRLRFFEGKSLRELQEHLNQIAAGVCRFASERAR
jgi:RNA polymerase sigma-70 factor, ECF subfamily